MFSSHCDQFISLLCPILTHCDPRKSSIFPIFVIFVIYRPRFCPFVHFVIVLYCIYAFWDVNIISVIALYIALRGTRKIYLRSTISTVGGWPGKYCQMCSEFQIPVTNFSPFHQGGGSHTRRRFHNPNSICEHAIFSSNIYI